MKTGSSRIKALSLAMLMVVAMILSVMPIMKVNAAGQFTDLYQYVKTQSYVGDGSNIYYCDYNRYPFMDTTIWRIDKPKDSSIYDKIGYYIADFDSDGDDELLTFSFNTDFIPVISISELVDGTIVQSDSKVLDSAINVDGYSCNYSIDTLPKGYLNCFVYPMKGGLYIGVEGKASPAFLAGGGYDASFSAFSYDDGKLTPRFVDVYDDGIEELSYDGGYSAETARLKKAGFDFEFTDLLGEDFNSHYSSLIKGSQKVCGIRKDCISYETGIAAGFNTANRPSHYENFSKITLYNLGNDNSTGDGTMYRFYNKGNGEHFYTTSPSEKSWLICTYWDYEGVAWKAPEVSNTPVYRFYNKYTNDHHYTTDVGEKAYLESIEGWNYEGIGWYSDDERTVPLYRLFNPNALGAGSHHYTKDAGERDYLKSIGWNYEGIAWYGM